MARIGLALGSGGARGWCHIGALRVLEEAGLRPDVVAGTSMGALVGAAYCSGVLDALEAFAREMTPLSMMRMVDLGLRTGGLVAGNAILQALEDLGLRESFADLDRPFIAVATDLYRGRELWLREGALLPAVRASIAIPGIFTPIRHDERWLMDGGMTNPVPVSACRALGADIVIAVDPNARLRGPGSISERRRRFLPTVSTATVIRQLPAKLRPLAETYFANGAASDDCSSRSPGEDGPPGYVDVLATAIDVMIDQIRRSRLAGDPPDIMIEPDLSDLNVLSFYEADSVIERGRAAMARNMERIHAMKSTFR